MKRFGVVFVLAIIASSVLAVPASAAGTALTIGGFNDMVVDNTHGHVFVSPGGGNSTVAVMDFNGASIATFNGGAGASGMVLSADDSTLYIVRHTANEIDAFSTSSPYTKTQTISTSPASCPNNVARNGNVLWFGYGCAGNGGFASVDPTAVSPTVTDYDSLGPWYDPIVAIPSSAQTLFVGERSQSPCELYRFDISTGAPTNKVYKFNPGNDGCSNLGAMAANSNGSKIYVAGGAPYEIISVNGSDLSNGQVYPTNPYPDAVALTADGGFVAGGMDGYYGAVDLDVFKATGESTFSYTDSSGSSIGVARNGLDYALDGTLFAVFADNLGGNITFRVFQDTAKDPSSIVGNAAPNPVARNTSSTISGSLQYPLGGTVGVQTLHVKRVNWDATQTALPDVATASDGSFSFSATSPDRATGILLSFDGDATHRSTSSTIPWTVTGSTPSITVGLSKATVNYKQSITITAHLGTTFTNRSLSIIAQPYGYSAKTLKTGTVNSSGNLSVSYMPGRKTSIWATFGGDAHYNKVSSTHHTASVRALVFGAMANAYGTSGKYKLVHYSSYCPSQHTHCPLYKGVVSPNHSGSLLYFTLQAYEGGAWRTLDSKSATISSTGYVLAAVFYDGPGVKGVPQRIHCSFKGDSDHLGATSSWSFFKVTS